MIEAHAADEVPFPSRAWFERLARAMNGNRTRQEQLGYVDCIAEFAVLDGGRDRTPLRYRVTFEEFRATAVDEAAPAAPDGADFTLEASLASWREMIENIAAGGGRPDLEHSLNRLSHMGTPFRLVARDPVQSDLYFRYNQSLQEFFNASAGFTTIFA